MGSEPLVGTLLRMSLPGAGAHGEPLAVPGFGTQLQQRAVFGTLPEATVSFQWMEHAETLADGTVINLREPVANVDNAYAPLPAGVLWSPRVAPPVFGLGLLEAIPEADVRAAADEFDANGDGISGRAQETWDIAAQRMALGRFGWKAEQPTVLQQSAGAYTEDMGVTTPLFPQETAFGQPQHDGYADDAEITDSILHAVSFYIRTLAVPAQRRTDDPEVVRGGSLFQAALCDRCHVPEQHTRVDVAFPPLSNQRIFPYTDLLLHDLGEGLNDHRPAYRAQGNEWRTPPLWGIGLTQVVNGHQNFLHDGRARNVLEAILWHGGEAQQSADRVRAMTSAERAALVAFLSAL